MAWMSFLRMLFVAICVFGATGCGSVVSETPWGEETTTTSMTGTVTTGGTTTTTTDPPIPEAGPCEVWTEVGFSTPSNNLKRGDREYVFGSLEDPVTSLSQGVVYRIKTDAQGVTAEVELLGDGGTEFETLAYVGGRVQADGTLLVLGMYYTQEYQYVLMRRPPGGTWDVVYTGAGRPLDMCRTDVDDDTVHILLEANQGTSQPSGGVVTIHAGQATFTALPAESTRVRGIACGPAGAVAVAAEDMVGQNHSPFVFVSQAGGPWTVLPLQPGTGDASVRDLAYGEGGDLLVMVNELNGYHSDGVLLLYNDGLMVASSLIPDFMGGALLRDEHGVVVVGNIFTWPPRIGHLDIEGNVLHEVVWDTPPAPAGNPVFLTVWRGADGRLITVFADAYNPWPVYACAK